jgi:hypothetical protein
MISTCCSQAFYGEVEVLLSHSHNSVWLSVDEVEEVEKIVEGSVAAREVA